MFRKPFSINQTHKVSGADRKKIRRFVHAQQQDPTCHPAPGLPHAPCLLSVRASLNRAVEKALHLDADSTALDALLPAKAGELEVVKLPAPSRLVIYLLDGVPVLLDTSGKSDFVPTVLGLWACPALLPVVTCKAWQVSQYLVGGGWGINPECSLAEPSVFLLCSGSAPHFRSVTLIVNPNACCCCCCCGMSQVLI